MTQANHYEIAGDGLKGEQAERAYRAAQNHLVVGSTTYLADWKRLQAKIIQAASK